MKSRKEWLKENLNEDQYIQALDNMKDDPYYTERLNEICDHFLQALYGSFLFHQSNEGFSYWANIVTEREMLIGLYPNLQPPLTPFKRQAKLEHAAEEYECAQAWLDNHWNIPKESSTGETYSLIGRIELLVDKVMKS